MKTTKEETTKLIEVDSSRTVDEYKNLATFKKEGTDVSSYCYEYSFDVCKAKARELCLGLDLKKVVLQEEEEKIIMEGKSHEGHAKEKAIIEGVVPPTILEETLVEETILPIFKAICQAPHVPDEDA